MDMLRGHVADRSGERDHAAMAGLSFSPTAEGDQVAAQASEDEDERKEKKNLQSMPFAVDHGIRRAIRIDPYTMRAAGVVSRLQCVVKAATASEEGDIRRAVGFCLVVVRVLRAYGEEPTPSEFDFQDPSLHRNKIRGPEIAVNCFS